MGSGAIRDMNSMPADARRIHRVVSGALEALSAGRPILLIHNFKDTAHLVGTARHATPETLATIGALGRGVWKAATTPARMAELRIVPGPASTRDGRRYSAPVDLAGHDRFNSPGDRAATARALDRAEAGEADLVTPGHLFPVEADEGGILASPHIPEAALELARLSGGVVGIYADLEDQEGLGGIAEDLGRQRRLAERFGIFVLTVRDLISELEWADNAASHVISVGLPTTEGDVEATGYRALRTKAENVVALVHGEPGGNETFAYVHTRCLVSDVFGGLDCGCGEQLQAARDEIKRRGHGVVLYSAWGDGQALGHLTPPAPPAPPVPGAEFSPRREREVAAVLRDLGIHSVRLRSNEPLDARFMGELGIEVLDADPPASGFPASTSRGFDAS
jgi:3,4-dihydroxy 2-butanone 4-phosphate synthase/GTP cyclohydrolase II